MINARQPIQGRHVFFALLAFFSAIISVNLVFTYFAITTFSGIETENSYVKGLNYNEKIAAAARQAELGWQTKLDYQFSEGRLSLNVSFKDASGHPLNGLEVTARLYRPAHAGHDQVLNLTSLGEGHYGTEVAVPLNGQWKLDLGARDSTGTTYHEERRLWLK